MEQVMEWRLLENGEDGAVENQWHAHGASGRHFRIDETEAGPIHLSVDDKLVKSWAFDFPEMRALALANAFSQAGAVAVAYEMADLASGARS